MALRRAAPRGLSFVAMLAKWQACGICLSALEFSTRSVFCGFSWELAI
jgi:hypothetical protein